MNNSTQSTNQLDNLDTPGVKRSGLVVSIPKVEYIADDMAKALVARGERACVQDKREQLPLPLDLPTVRRRLATGDYSLLGYEDVIAVERKSANDLIGCCGRDQARFGRCVDRLLAFPFRLVIVEDDWATVVAETRRGKVGPAFVERLVIEWMARGLPFVFKANRREAAETVKRFLERSAKEHDRNVANRRKGEAIVSAEA